MKSLNEPFVSIIIPIFNARDVIEDCLNSIFDIEYKNFEVIIVDDCSIDKSADFIQNNYSQVRVLATKKNSGFAAAVNFGIKNSCSDIVVLLNMDTVVRPRWLSPIVKLLIEDESIGLVGSKILFPDGKTIQHAGGLLRGNGVSLHIGRGDLDNDQFEFVKDVDYLCGASLGFRRSLLDKIGMFDENYKPLYYEDTDLAYRAKAAGKKVVYIPDSVLIHKENVSTAGLTPRFYYYFHKSRLRFVFKNYPLRGIFFGFFKEEKKWLAQELPVAIRPTLFKAYASVLFLVPCLLFRRIVASFFKRRTLDNRLFKKR